MRLTRLYLAGFKSFAAPTEILLPDARVAIVGPNGCGKSNLIDAIRWVLGESSARQLRGAALDDVIFAGSGQRPAASQAVVELSFDNSMRRLSGPFAAFDAITVRRSLGRDGQSRYEINQTRVRRRDVVDLFLGTGVGARSYSVIEQGQVNRIVDARPEELRGYLEETAGISLYRERRRETQSRMMQTQENLSRLTDMADELSRQQSQLERQAKTAERYRILQRQRRRVIAEQAAVAHVLAERAQTTAGQRVEAHTADLAARALLLAEHEQARQTATAARQAALLDLQNAQAQLYRVASERAQCDGGLGALIAQLEALTAQQTADLTQRAQVTEALGQQQTAQAERELAGITLEQARRAATEHRAEVQTALRVAETELAAQRQAWRIAQERLALPQQQLAAAEAELATLTRQSQRLAADTPPPAEPFDRAAWGARLADLAAKLAAAEAEKLSRAQRLVQAQSSLAAQETALANARTAMQHAQKAHDTVAAEEAGLMRLLQPATKPDGKRATQPEGAPPESLMTQLARAQAPAWWGHALGAHIEAHCVDDLDALVRQWQTAGARPAGGYWVAPNDAAPTQSTDLAQAPLPAVLLQPWLSEWQQTCHPADDLSAALRQRHRLPPGQRFVLADGWQVGRHWLGRAPQDTAAVRLAQHSRLQQLALERADAARALQTCEAAYQQQQAALTLQQRAQADALSALRAQEQTLARSQTEHTEAVHQHQRLIERAAEQQARQAQREREQARLAGECAELERKIAQCRLALKEAAAQRDAAAAKQQAQETLVQQLRRTAGEAAQMLQTAERAVDQNQHQQSQAQQFLARDQALLAQIDARLAEFGRKITALTEQKNRQQAEQTILMAQQTAAATEEARAQAEQIRATEALQQVESQCHAAERAHSAAQTAVQTAAVQLAQAQVRAEHTEHALREALDALADDSITLQAPVIEQLADVPDMPARQAAERAALTQQIDRLGAVNLTAIAAFAEVQARKAELDAQINDLRLALAQLTEAIALLDRQTRAQFRQIFDAVNTRIGPLFVQLFGGGEARLNLTGSDELNDGLELIARPPGKKTTQLSLLSGGERALTAVALIFALFELNPAPFCILDEVDAPLDEANVGRFCAMVSAMSDRVQFLFVTHNKTTMASANALIGVTMREAGVSRIVSVDVDRAVQLLES
jgi:chromosome segregation protein